MKELEAEVQKTLLTRTAREWEEKFNQEGVPAMQVLSLLEAINQRRLRRREFIKRFDATPRPASPPMDTHRAIASRRRLPSSTSAAPRHGEHTDAILSALGLSQERSPACAAEDRVAGRSGLPRVEGGAPRA